MATHDVTVDLPTRFVLHSDVTFVVWSDDAKLGELQVSKGSIDWLPGNGRTRHRVRWEKFKRAHEERGPRDAALGGPSTPGRREGLSTQDIVDNRERISAAHDSAEEWLVSTVMSYTTPS
jgi:hypothetical protein